MVFHRVAGVSSEVADRYRLIAGKQGKDWGFLEGGGQAGFI